MRQFALRHAFKAESEAREKELAAVDHGSSRKLATDKASVLVVLAVYKMCPFFLPKQPAAICALIEENEKGSWWAKTPLTYQILWAKNSVTMLGVLDVSLDSGLRTFAPIKKEDGVAERKAKERGSEELVRRMVVERGSTADFVADNDSASGGLTSYIGSTIVGVTEQRATATRLAEVQKLLQDAQASTKAAEAAKKLADTARKKAESALEREQNKNPADIVVTIPSTQLKAIKEAATKGSQEGCYKGAAARVGKKEGAQGGDDSKSSTSSDSKSSTKLLLKIAAKHEANLVRLAMADKKSFLAAQGQTVAIVSHFSEAMSNFGEHARALSES